MKVSYFRWGRMSARQKQVLCWWQKTSKYADYNGIICDGAIRSGKTVSMAFSFVLWAMTTFNNYNFAMCGKTIASFRRNVLGTLKNQLMARGYTVVDKRAENLVVISKGKKTNLFYIFGGKDESSQDLIQGLTLAGVFCDEVALMPRSFVEQAIARCSVDGSKFWFNCNPEGPLHWFYLEWIKKCRKRKMLYLHFTMADNLTLSEEIKERYQNQFSGVFYDRYIKGLWVKAEGLVYPMFNKDTHILSETPEYSLRHRYYVSVDYGTVNPFAAGLYDYDPIKQRAIMIKEFYYKGGSTKRVDNEMYYKNLCELIGDYPIEYIIIDPSAASMIETIQKYSDYLVVKADNDVLNGIQDVTKFLNSGVLFFTKDCKETFNEFYLYSWDEESKEDAVIKQNDHSMDQLRYFCRTALRSELKWIV